MEQKEQAWLKKRAGKITSSALAKLFTGGSRPATPEEIQIYKLIKSTRKTTNLEFGEGAIKYLYQLQREKRLGKPTWQRDNYNFNFGHLAEPYAIMWLKANRPDLIVKHCSSDDFPEIVFCKSEAGAWDSPDFYCGMSIVGEIKAPVDQAKFEQMRDTDAVEAMEEYKWQFANHLNCNPNCKTLMYLCYDFQVDDDEFDILDPLDPSRGIIFTYDRSEFQDLIEQIEAKVKYVMAFLADVDAGKCRVRDINNWKPSSPIDGFILPEIKMGSDMVQQIMDRN